MPWFGWIAIAAILAFSLVQAISMVTGRPLPGGSDSSEELEELRKRLKKLEKAQSAGELEAPNLPTKAEENMAAEDRWRLDMLEARLEELEKRNKPDDGA
ncbi:hypothetical protein [Nesterenkonia flava]|uniref:SHOCT domain-containing protein n=1 Tax=Nesterenkonia flava TaxID=469799 RepID=A0ABU1FR80_9MICC|nr:hypothetical protein [Nesterenkonia flava]MDR5711159.1 hypothetical protein [Nesterenkonia flava]